MDKGISKVEKLAENEATRARREFLKRAEKLELQRQMAALSKLSKLIYP